MIANIRETTTRGTRGFLILALISFLVASQLRSQVADADAEFAAGLLAKDKGQVDAALHHLQSAVILDPGMTKAHLAIGAIADLWCHGSKGGDLCKLALDEYKKVLELDPSQYDVLKSIAYASYALDYIDEAETYYRRALALNQDDPEALGGVAAMDYRRISLDVATAKAENGVAQGKPFIHSGSCQEVREKNLARAEEGIDLLLRALKIHNSDPEMMSFLSALYRLGAEIQCGNRQAYNANSGAARKWNHMVHEALKKTRPSEASLRRLPPAPPPAPDGK